MVSNGKQPLFTDRSLLFRQVIEGIKSIKDVHQEYNSSGQQCREVRKIYILGTRNSGGLKQSLKTVMSSCNEKLHCFFVLLQKIRLALPQTLTNFAHS